MKIFIEDLLTLSRVSIEPKKHQMVSLDAVITNVLSDLELSIKEKQGEIIFHGLPKTQGDRLLLQQLFQKLLSNGLKFHASGRPPVIKVSSTKVECGFWQVLVQDNRIGTATKNIERIFKPFERLHGKSIYEGTGIGLAICQKIIERHHGTITVKSEMDQGTCFILNLPDCQPEENSTNL